MGETPSVERATIPERPWDNPTDRATAELTALIVARPGNILPSCSLVERFTVAEGELVVKRDRQASGPVGGL
jgi:hypothetical protein